MGSGLSRLSLLLLGALAPAFLGLFVAAAVNTDSAASTSRGILAVRHVSKAVRRRAESIGWAVRKEGDVLGMLERRNAAPNATGGDGQAELPPIIMWYHTNQQFFKHNRDSPDRYLQNMRPGVDMVRIGMMTDNDSRATRTALAWNKARQYAALNSWAKRHLPECPDDGTTFQTYYLYNTTQCGDFLADVAAHPRGKWLFKLVNGAAGKGIQIWMPSQAAGHNEDESGRLVNGSVGSGSDQDPNDHTLPGIAAAIAGKQSARNLSRNDAFLSMPSYMRKRYFHGLSETLLCPGRKYLAQSYLDRPLLINGGRKFDVRYYVLLARWDPPLAFYCPGYTRQTLHPYEGPDSTALDSGLTNVHVQKKLPRPDGTFAANSSDYGNQFWSMDQLRAHLRERSVQGDVSAGRVAAKLENDDALKRVQARAIAAMLPRGGGDGADFEPVPGGFDVLGCDQIISESGDFYFIECNKNPGTSTRFQSPFHERCTAGMMDVLARLGEKGAVSRPGAGRGELAGTNNGSLAPIVDGDWFYPGTFECDRASAGASE
uniref:Tubulin--tyrosine ligase-like protein 9 n=1 Tax=Prasinoderma coloniale TaxID=156133 RepID=A0A7R9T8R8_9VIRI|mmetsp:Transcript_10683/g.44177  ORF Transcript_10683/g.44177 Transcript_10683/m.44177 type:complete len:544 (+) Transcript_10683:180-1811(+)